MGHGSTNKCEATGTVTADGAKIDFDVTFADKPGQTGVQFLLEVDTTARTAAGSFPPHAGISGGTYTIGEVIGSSDSALGALSELAECSDRGLDMATASASASTASAASRARSRRRSSKRGAKLTYELRGWRSRARRLLYCGCIYVLICTRRHACHVRAL